MTTTALTPNLKLRIDSNLTANAKYNLLQIDELGSTFLVDTTSTLNIRSSTNIVIEPESADVGGSGVGGTVSIGTSNHLLTSLNAYVTDLNLPNNLGLLDQASGGSRYLRMKYKSDIHGIVDGGADRVLSVDLEGSSRNLVLGGDLQLLAGSLVLNLSGSTSLLLPTTGTLATLAGSEILTNKSIDATSNTLQNITSNNISNSAAIPYSKLLLTGGITNADVSASAFLDGTKINPNFGNQTVKTLAGIQFSVGGHTTDLLPAQSGQIANLSFRLPNTAGTTGQVLSTNGAGVLSWLTTPGTGTVTSVDLTVPAEFIVTGSPITSIGILAIAKATQAANMVYSGPTTGAAAAPTFRSLVPADLPTAIPAINIGLGTVDNITLGYLAGATSVVQTQLDSKQPLNLGLTALAGLATTGLVVRTGSGTATTRTLTAGSGISITNGDGVAGVPSIASTITQYTDEMAQDAVGGILTNTSSLAFTYDDPGNIISAAVLPAGVDHNQLLNFVSNKHIDHSAVSITTLSNSGLAGGGNLTTTRNLLVDPSNAPLIAPDTGDLILFADISNSNSLSKTTLATAIALFTGKVTATWASGDGTTKAVTHSLGTTAVSVTIFDIDSGADILVDSVVRTSSSVVTLTSSQAPTGSGWTVIVRN